MELFERAKTVRLKSRHDKYLFADDDETHVIQDRNGASSNARWLVEQVVHGGTQAQPVALRFKSRYGRYLTASNEPFLMGVTGRKVLQTAVSGRADSSIEWEPVREGFQVRLKTRYGNYLRANGGLPPWRNSVTHDVPHRTVTQDWVLWDLEIVEIATPKPDSSVDRPVPPVQDNRRDNSSRHRYEHPTVHKSTGSNPVNIHNVNASEGNTNLPRVEVLIISMLINHLLFLVKVLRNIELDIPGGNGIFGNQLVLIKQLNVYPSLITDTSLHRKLILLRDPSPIPFRHKCSPSSLFAYQANFGHLIIL
jgi:Domain of unknown function (DUF569)